MSSLQTDSSPTSNYGKACTNCSKAKCKCTYAKGQDVCERCARLRKDCRPLVSVRKRTVRYSNTSSSAAKQQRLEQKLDSLVSLLQAQGNASEVLSSLPAQLVNSQSSATSPQSPEDKLTSSASTISATCSALPVSTAPTSPNYGDTAAIPASYAASQAALDQFREESLKFFPFIYLPPHMTVLQLSHDFPILWLSISATSAKSTTQLTSVSEKLQATLLDKLYAQGERSLDLLLACLSYIGWFRLQRRQRPFFNMWTQLAASLAVELGLSKDTPGDAAYFCFLSVWPHTRSVAKRERTMLERRAVLSTFLMSSWVHSSFRKGDTMKWTPHMDESVRVLENQPEWEGDRLLAYQVRCQLILQQIYESPWQGGIASADAKSAAPDYFIKGLNMQLQEVRTKLGTLSGQREDALKLFVLNTDLTIHEACQELPITNSDNGIVERRRLEPFYDALFSIKAWLEIFFTMSNLSHINSTFSLFSQFVHCVVSLFRLSILDDPAWDRSFVKQTVDIVQVLDRFATNIERVRDARLLVIDNEEEDMFTKSAVMMRKLSESWALEIAAIGAKQKEQKEQAAGETEIPPELLEMGTLDSEWITDMFLAWDHQ